MSLAIFQDRRPVASEGNWLRQSVGSEDIAGGGRYAYIAGAYKDVATSFAMLAATFKAFGEQAWMQVGARFTAAATALAIPGVVTSSCIAVGSLQDLVAAPWERRSVIDVTTSFADFGAATLSAATFALDCFGQVAPASFVPISGGLECFSGVMGAADSVSVLLRQPNNFVEPLGRKLADSYWWKNVFSLIKNTFKVAVGVVTLLGVMTNPYVLFGTALAFFIASIGEHYNQKQMELAAANEARPRIR